MQFGSVTTVSTGTGTETPQLIVKAIVYSEDNPSAVIGKQIVHEGDEISGATIVKINEDSVEFEMNGERWKQKVQ
jgi:type II secretory pathway component PulC